MQARLALISIREEDWERAERELAEVRADNPTAKGRLGGRDGVLAELLAGLLKQARQEPGRTDVQEVSISKGPCELLWSQPLENKHLSISPVVVDDMLIYQDATSVRALKLADGEQVFQAKGKVFRSPGSSPSQSPSSSTESLGQPHFALTANDRFLFGVTTVPIGLRRKPNGSNVQSTLWSLDLQRDGALALDQPSEEAGVAFVGAPVAVGMQLFVPIRSHDQSARAGIACYDLSTANAVGNAGFVRPTPQRPAGPTRSPATCSPTTQEFSTPTPTWVRSPPCEQMTATFCGCELTNAISRTR